MAVEPLSPSLESRKSAGWHVTWWLPNYCRCGGWILLNLALAEPKLLLPERMAAVTKHTIREMHAYSHPHRK
jgi:hypothetical protein